MAFFHVEMCRFCSRLLSTHLRKTICDFKDMRQYSNDQCKTSKLPKKITVPNIKLNSGYKIPVLGLGTWQSPPGVVTQAVMDAIDAGYRHIDCALVYQNEGEVGKGLDRKLNDGVVKRKDLFITSKLWNTFHHPDSVCAACESSLKSLKLSYLDLYLIHWPMGYQEDCGLFPLNEKGKIMYSEVDYVDTWKVMETLAKTGFCRSIGISNFNKNQIKRILKRAEIVPAVNQVECHPYLNQRSLMKFCKSKGIYITAYSPLGAPARPSNLKKADDPVLMNDKTIISIAKQYKKTPAQVLIRYQIQRGNIVIPKSVTKSRIIDNMNVFDFELCPESMDELKCLNRNARYVDLKTIAGDHEHYPFRDKLDDM